MSPLHTHDPTGILHIESGDATQFTLGQFFTESNIRLISSCLGGLCADSSHQLAVITNGRPDTGDPAPSCSARVRRSRSRTDHAGTCLPPPSSYPFPAGL